MLQIFLSIILMKRMHLRLKYRAKNRFKGLLRLPFCSFRLESDFSAVRSDLLLGVRITKSSWGKLNLSDAAR